MKSTVGLTSEALPPAEVERTLRRLQVPYGEFTSEQVTSLEDAFIGLTGKY